jgi:putative SOS response-associated peptidase YedK
MCGRYVLDVRQEDIEEYYHARFAEETYNPHYNLAPSPDLPVVLDENPELIQCINWGLHPNWFKYSKGLINLKAETMRDKPFMRRYLKKRCLIPATGFYEWRTEDIKNKTKTPYYIFLEDRKLFSFAGVWAQEKDNQGNITNNFAIITTTSNGLISTIHTRMPVILPKEQEDMWLDQDLNEELALQLLRSYPDAGMGKYPISPTVNSPKNDSPTVLKPIGVF